MAGLSPVRCCCCCCTATGQHGPVPLPVCAATGADPLPRRAGSSRGAGGLQHCTVHDRPAGVRACMLDPHCRKCLPQSQASTAPACTHLMCALHNLSALTGLSALPAGSVAHRTLQERQMASRCSPSGWRRPWVWRKLLRMCWGLQAGVPLPARLPWLGQRVLCPSPGGPASQVQLQTSRQRTRCWCLMTLGSCGQQQTWPLMMRLGWMASTQVCVFGGWGRA